MDSVRDREQKIFQDERAPIELGTTDSYANEVVYWIPVIWRN